MQKYSTSRNVLFTKIQTLFISFTEIVFFTKIASVSGVHIGRDKIYFPKQSYPIPFGGNETQRGNDVLRSNQEPDGNLRLQSVLAAKLINTFWVYTEHSEQSLEGSGTT